MAKLYIVLCLAVLCNVTLGLSLRHKRQSNTDDNDDVDDRYGGFQGPRFPGQGWDDQRPTGPQNRPRPTRPTPRPTTPAVAGSTTQSSSVEACLRTCPVTPEYNPVCGTNSVQYFNPGRLTCAQACGVNVSLQRAAPCPPSTPAPAPQAA